jgi:serine/threonine-protein kinase
MSESSRGDFRALAAELDASSSQPTAELLAESISRLKIAPTSHAAGGPLGHLFPVSALDHTGPFRLVCEIASGGMATMHLAINRGILGFEKFVAVKCIHPHLAQAKEFSELFVDEARIAARVDHPYVCRVFDFGRAEHGYYMAMEFLHGEPLSKVLTCAGETNLHQPRFPHIAARIIANWAEGLHAAHSLCDSTGRNLDIIHRDVTPQNLFVLYDGTVRVTDFGIARARDRLQQTHGGQLKGTLTYLAPEQLERSEIDHGVDIWALGVVLWEMLTARKLFRCSSQGEAATDVLTRLIVAPSQFNPYVSRELDQIVLCALARDRRERYGSAAELARALEQYLTHSGASVLAMDVAEWLAGLFPTGKERGRELLELARARAEEMPRFSASHAPEPRPQARDTLGSLSACELEDERTESLSITHAITLSSQRARRRFLLDRVGALSLAGSLALVGIGVGSLTRRSASTVLPGPAPAAALASPAPNARSSPYSDTRSAPLAGPPSRAILPDSTKSPADGHARALASRPLTTRQKALPASLLVVPKLASAQLGSVFVSTPGVSAEVFEGGRALGQTPRQIEFSPGPHTLLLKSEHGARAVFVDVKAGSAAVLSLSLADAPKGEIIPSAALTRVP